MDTNIDGFGDSNDLDFDDDDDDGDIADLENFLSKTLKWGLDKFMYIPETNWSRVHNTHSTHPNKCSKVKVAQALKYLLS